MKNNAPYLLTGGRGTLGRELQHYLKCYVPPRRLLDITWSAKSIAEELYPHYDLQSCKGIIHAAAWTDVPGAETNRNAVVQTNIVGCKNIADLSKLGVIVGHHIPVYYISTDYVYEGLVGNYSEDSQPKPFNFYGFSKLAGESFFGNKDAIIRTSFKPKNLWPKKYTKAFTDIYSSADYVDIIVKDIAFAIHSNLRGIYNIGTYKKSIYELAAKRCPEVEAMTRYDVRYIVMPKDISMNVDKYMEFKGRRTKEFSDFIGDNNE